ncbi:hypothetical protein VTK56DRAFT_6065 [Thermocarpiscus australiensis]
MTPSRQERIDSAANMAITSHFMRIRFLHLHEHLVKHEIRTAMGAKYSPERIDSILHQSLSIYAKFRLACEGFYDRLDRTAENSEIPGEWDEIYHEAKSYYDKGVEMLRVFEGETENWAVEWEVLGIKPIKKDKMATYQETKPYAGSQLRDQDQMDVPQGSEPKPSTESEASHEPACGCCLAYQAVRNRELVRTLMIFVEGHLATAEGYLPTAKLSCVLAGLADVCSQYEQAERVLSRTFHNAVRDAERHATLQLAGSMISRAGEQLEALTVMAGQQLETLSVDILTAQLQGLNV